MPQMTSSAYSSHICGVTVFTFECVESYVIMCSLLCGNYELDLLCNNTCYTLQ